jgi:sigma-54-specific transcriptional regulator
VLKPEFLNLPLIQTTQHKEETVQFYQEHCTLEKVFKQLFDQEFAELHDVVMRKLVLQAYEHASENQVQAAKILGISRNVLRTYLKNFGVID